jgi:GT2 family glycosyltransferase
MIYAYFYNLLYKYLSFFVRPGDKVVEIDPQTPHLMKRFFEDHNKCVVFVDNSRSDDDVRVLQGLDEIKSFRPDYIILNGALHYVRDIQSYLERLWNFCEHDTRIIITYYSSAWRPVLKAATAFGLRVKDPEQNWISHEDIDNLLYLSGFQMVKRESRILIPVYIPFLSNFMNRCLACLPFFRIFTMVNIVVARPLVNRDDQQGSPPSVSVIIPARNETANIENAILRLPQMGPEDEVIFVEGGSTDNTWGQILEIQKKYAHSHTIRIARQDGAGKGDAVRKGFSLATKQMVMILDADLTVPPEDLPKFYDALVNNKGEFINGSRLVYPMEKDAMRFFNMLGNKFFAAAFSFILGQRFKDTLCGTKAMSRENYLKIAQHRSYFGDFDPFGDFDLIFGACRLGLKVVEIPIGYRERTYGTTNIQRWKHGFILLRMLFFAARKIKFI